MSVDGRDATDAAARPLSALACPGSAVHPSFFTAASSLTSSVCLFWCVCWVRAFLLLLCLASSGTVRNFNEPASRRNTTMSRSELVEWFCRTGPFEHWKENLVWGCIKTVQDHHDDVLAPFLGTHVSHEYTTLASVFNHRVTACALKSVDACDAWQPEGRSKTDCATCDRLARDLHWSLSREQKVNKTVVEKTLGVICMEVGMRHERPMEIEAFCHEHVDEHWVSLNKALVRIFNDVSIPSDREKIAAIKRRFCGGLTEVCEDEAAADRADRKRRKDEEKAARLRAREEKKAAAAATGAGTDKKQKDEL